jgi:hypothetical protein
MRSTSGSTDPRGANACAADRMPSSGSTTASLRELACILDSGRVLRTPTALRGLRPELLRHAYLELRAIPPLRISVDDSELGRKIRAELGIWMIRWAMELPASFDQFMASHERANNLRKSVRRVQRAGISFRVLDGRRERAAVLATLLTAWGGGQLPDGLGPDIGTHMVALDSHGRPLAVAIMLESGRTAQLPFLVVDRSWHSRSAVRYAMNAFAIHVAIESALDVMLLTDTPLYASSGIGVLATNCGYRARRILLDWDVRNRHHLAAKALHAIAPPAGISKHTWRKNVDARYHID